MPEKGKKGSRDRWKSRWLGAAARPAGGYRGCRWVVRWLPKVQVGGGVVSTGVGGGGLRQQWWRVRVES